MGKKPSAIDKEGKNLFAAALTPGSGENLQKDDLLTIIYWLRQLLAIALGIGSGLYGVRGATGIVGFGVINVVVFGLYRSKFLGVDDEELEIGFQEVNGEGMMPAFATYTLCWTLLYSAINFP
eukprot:TRINITY_DN3688_c0_g1_i1.p1 TRINITY_DN3688_c0_g1~~TRINITY_DN3688_c0_g1_i1.p1  ORF type:complete len:123 (-),score=26.75 TRINITY_DN3688_c0_g1_i1:71-439(-)